MVELVSFLRDQGKPTFDEELVRFTEEGPDMAAGEGEEEVDEMFDQAVSVVAETRNASISYVQRRLKIGYNRSARIVEKMENDGMVGLKAATLTTAAMFVVVSVSGINFANLIFVSTIALSILTLIIWELVALVRGISRLATKIKAVVGIVTFSMSLLASISRVNVISEEGLNDWNTAIDLAFGMYLDIINLILYYIELMGS